MNIFLLNFTVIMLNIDWRSIPGAYPFVLLDSDRNHVLLYLSVLQMEGCELLYHNFTPSVMTLFPFTVPLYPFYDRGHCATGIIQIEHHSHQTMIEHYAFVILFHQPDIQ